jgi:uncharacterized protein (TIGR04255 family)
MSNKYAKPPIIEAVCDIRFDQASSWDLAIPGLFSERFKSSYPQRRQAAAVDLAISTTKGQLEQVLSRQDRLQLYDETEKDVLQIGPHLLAVNRLAPYNSWQEFEPNIMTAFEAYLDIAKPIALSRVGLRALNRVEIPKPMVQMEDYFDFYPHLGNRLPQEINPFLVGVEFAFEGGRDRLRLELQSALSNKKGTVSSLLTLDYYCQGAGKVTFAQVRDWLRAGHRALDDVFEGCLKDPLREIFEPVKVAQ